MLCSVSDCFLHLLEQKDGLPHTAIILFYGGLIDETRAVLEELLFNYIKVKIHLGVICRIEHGCVSFCL